MTTLAIEIRKAEIGDAAAVAEVHRAAWLGAYTGIIPFRSLHSMVNRRNHGWWANAIRRAVTVLVIDIGGEVAGYATIGRNRARELPQQGEIYELYLKPEYQGVGLGSRLFSAARTRLADLGLRGLVVWALDDNEAAQSFYRVSGGRDLAEGVEVFEGQALKKIAFVWS